MYQYLRKTPLRLSELPLALQILKIDALVAAAGSNGVLADTRALSTHELVGWAGLAAPSAIHGYVAACSRVGGIVQRVNAGVPALGQVVLRAIENARPLHTLLIG